MRANLGNIVAYAIGGASPQPIASADSGDVLAHSKIAAAVQLHVADCGRRGVPSAVRVVHEFAEANAHGQITASEYTELHPHSFVAISETCAKLSDIFDGAAKPPKGK